MMLLWIVLIIAIVYFIVRAASGERGAPPGGKTPLEILESRYASGEISEDEFEQKKRKLTSEK